LAAHKVALKPNINYQWSISVVPNPNERSNDVMSGGALRRVAMPDALAARRAQLAPAQLARAYAAEGLWYDSIGLYSDLIDKNPSDRKLREARASLLEQVGLKEVAAYDRRPE